MAASYYDDAYRKQVLAQLGPDDTGFSDTGTGPGYGSGGAPVGGSSPPPSATPPASPVSASDAAGSALANAGTNQAASTAQTWENGPGATAPKLGGKPSLAQHSTDRNAILSAIAWYGQQPGANPSVAANPNYWADRILAQRDANGQQVGWDDTYWPGRFMMAEGEFQDNGNQTPTTQVAAPQGIPGPTPANQAANDALTAQFRQSVLDLIQKNSSTGPINPQTDPNLAPQAAAYKTAQEQNQTRQRGAIAERLAAAGLNSGGQGSGAFDTQLGALSEQTGQNIGTFNAGLVGQEVAARRQQLQQALDLANAFGARTEATALQAQIANLENQYRYSALNQNQGQFEDSTAFSYAQLKATLDRQAILAAMGP